MTRTADLLTHPGRRAPEVTLRELGPGAADVLDAVFAGLSPTSRALRFHTAMPRLSAAMRAQLADVDGFRHIAVAAYAAGTGEPVGIARLIAIGSGPPGRAELAVEVVDAWQGRGIGTRLVREILDRGRAAGHTEVVAEVLVENTAVQALLFAALPYLSWTDDGPERTIIAPLARYGVAA